ncbi:MAG: hypothetical protein ACLGH8_09655 [Bacteroidia bacterium]
MKKPVILIIAVFSLFSCDYILKKQEKTAKEPASSDAITVTDADKDKNGCVPSAGYHWSVMRKDCIRPVEEGFRLNSIEKIEDESDIKSAFVIFSEDKEQAELFLPDSVDSILLEKKDGNIYDGGGWTLHSDKGYSLKKGSSLLYVGAEAVQQGQVTGDENEES